MNVIVDPDLCYSCGNCRKKCPHVFKVGKVTSVKQNPIATCDEKDCIDATETCPRKAITLHS